MADFEAERLDTLLAAAAERFGPQWSAVLATARVWVNGDEPAHGPATPLCDGDEVAVLPPVSGGCADPTDRARTLRVPPLGAVRADQIPG